jgi:N-acyl-phosphatidylethanolamine-hydrolysing phospholipase D
MSRRALSGQQHKPDTTPPTVPIRKPTFLPSRKTETLRATWLGHACYYVEFPGGFRVLFDPVFEPRCSPFKWLGPKRYNDIPCQIDDIPTIDAVVISHNHYDHLSHPTITKIKELHPNVHYFVPLGNKKWFLDGGFHNVTELDWWQQRDIKLSLIKEGANSESKRVSVTDSLDSDASPEEIVATISCLPCQHVSARTPFDKCHTLWASWAVESGGKKVFFAG